MKYLAPPDLPALAAAPAVAAGRHYLDTGFSLLKYSDATAWWTAASETYVQSRGTQQVTNGTGLYKTNYNFSGWTFTAADAPYGYSGSFVSAAGVAATKVADEIIPVDPNKKIRLQFSARQLGTSVSPNGLMYCGFEPRDAYGNIIGPNMYMWVVGTDTTLAVQLKPGDTTVTLTDASNWYGSAGKPAGASTYLRALIFWNYTDAGGKAWPFHVYSRNVTASDMWADGSLSGNVITLRVPWAGATYPAGTQVSNATSGGSYMYMPTVSNVTVPPAWTTYADSVQGVFTPNGTGSATFATGWPPATAAARIIWLVNRLTTGANDTNSQHAIAGISLSDAAATATDLSSYVTLATTQTITAAKTWQVPTGTVAIAFTTPTNAINDVSTITFNGRSVFGYDGQKVVVGDMGSTKSIEFRSGSTGLTTDTKLTVSAGLGITGAPNINAQFQGNTLLTQLTASTIPLVVKANASPTASLTEWQNSAGTTVYAALTSLGVLNVNNTAVVSTYNAAAVPLAVKAGAGQTADLQQWVANDGTTVLGKVMSGGEHVISPAVPAGGDGAGPTSLVIHGYVGQFWRNFFRIEDSGGSELTNFAQGVQSWFNGGGHGGSFQVSWDYWTKPSGANVVARAYLDTQSAFRAVRDVLSVGGSHVAEFGTRDYVADTETVNAYISMEGNFVSPRVVGGMLAGVAGEIDVMPAGAAAAGTPSRNSGNLMLTTTRWTGSASVTEKANLTAIRRSSTASDMYLNIDREVVVQGLVSSGVAPSQIINLTHLTTKQYVDNGDQNQSFLANMPGEWTKTPVRLATTANIASLSGNLSVDGFTTAAGDRILVKDQTTTSQNGIYVASAGAWTRAADADLASELSGAVVYVELGSTNLGTYWSTPFVPTGVLGTDAMPWNRMGPEVAVQAAQPSGAFDLWVDIDDTAVPAPGLGSWEGRSTSSLTCTGTATLVPGTAVTIPVSATTDTFFVSGVFEFQATSTTDMTASGFLYVDGVEAPGTIRAVYRNGATVGRASVAQNWVITGLTAGNHTFDLRANATAGTSMVANFPHTHLVAVRIA